MTLTLEQRANLADNIQFQRKVRQALIRHAIYQRGLSVNGDNYRQMQTLGIAVLQNPEVESKRFSHGVASDPRITDATPDDETIGSVIEVIYPSYTGFIESPPAPDPEPEPEV